MFDTVVDTLNYLQSLPIDWHDVALLSCVAVSWIAVVIALVAMRRAQRQASLTREGFQQLNRDLQIASSAAIGMGRRIIVLERKLAGLKFDVETPAYSQSATSTNQSRQVQSPAKKTSPLKQQASQIARTLAGVQGDAKKPAPTAAPLPSLAVVTGNQVQKGLVSLKTEYPAAQKPKPSKKAAAPRPFEQAEKLLIAGIEPDEVAKRCGLTKSEAALMQMVLQQQRGQRGLAAS